MPLQIRNSALGLETIYLYASTADLNGAGISPSYRLGVSKGGVPYYAGLILESDSTPATAVMKSSLKVSVGGLTYAVAYCSKTQTVNTNSATIPATADNRGFLLQYALTPATGGGASGAQGGGGGWQEYSPGFFVYWNAAAGGSGGTGGDSGSLGLSVSRSSFLLNTAEANQWIGNTVTLTAAGAPAAVGASSRGNAGGNSGSYGSASNSGNLGNASSLIVGGYGVSSYASDGGLGGGGSARGGVSISNNGANAYGGQGGYGNATLGSTGGTTTNGSVGGGGGGAKATGYGGNGGDGGAGGGATSIYLGAHGASDGTAGGTGSGGSAGTASYSATYWVKGDY